MASYKQAKRKDDYDRDPKQEQEQSQDQKQDQHQSQWQFALNDNKNENENENENKNENTLDNKVDNDLDNKVDNDLDNKVDNKVDNDIENEISNKVETKVDVEVNVDIDLSVDLDELGGINIDELKDIDSSVIFTQTVDQKLDGDGNQFNVQQINNLVDNDKVEHAEVKFDGGWGDFKIDVSAEGGDNKLDDVENSIDDFGNLTAPVSADAINTVSAFTQNIVMGANIQFNSNSINAAVGDVDDQDHTL